MQHIISSNGITLFDTDGTIRVLPKDTFEYDYFIKNEGKDFPFVKNFFLLENDDSIYYDVSTKTVVLKLLGSFSFEISNSLKKMFVNGDTNKIANFSSFLRKSSKKTFDFINQNMTSECFMKNDWNSDCFMVKMSEKKISEFASNEKIVNFDNEVSNITVAFRLDENGDFEIYDALYDNGDEKCQSLAYVYSTLFMPWINVLKNNPDPEYLDEFYTVLNKKFDMKYSLKEFLQSMDNDFSSLKKIIFDLSLTDKIKKDEDYNDVF